MDNAGFSVSRWDHWLLIASFVGVASYGLWMSGQWKRKRHERQGLFSRSFSKASYGKRFSGRFSGRLSRPFLGSFAAKRRFRFSQKATLPSQKSALRFSRKNALSVRFTRKLTREIRNHYSDQHR